MPTHTRIAYRKVQQLPIATVTALEEEVLIRTTIAELIATIPTQQLKELFSMVKVNPFTREAKDWADTPEKQEILDNLKQTMRIMYEFKITTP